MKKNMSAITISPTELRANQRKYLDMAETTRVFVKRGSKVIELVVKEDMDTPSPSNDAWFDNPKAIAELARRIDAVKQGKTDFTTLDPAKSLWENIL